MSETCQCKRGRPPSQAESEVHASHPLGKRRQERNVLLVHGTTLGVARKIRDQRSMARQRTFFALGVNRKHGDTLHLRLARLVARFRRGMAEIGLCFHGGLFPVQTLAPACRLDAASLHEWLLRAGVRRVLHRARNGHGMRVSFLITARHLPQEIDLAVDALAEALRQGKPGIAAGGERQ